MISSTKFAIGAGIALILSGALFYMQSIRLAGPQESFMYNNPDWTGYGLVLVLAGSVTLAIPLLKNLRPQDP